MKKIIMSYILLMVSVAVINPCLAQGGVVTQNSSNIIARTFSSITNFIWDYHESNKLDLQIAAGLGYIDKLKRDNAPRGEIAKIERKIQALQRSRGMKVLGEDDINSPSSISPKGSPESTSPLRSKPIEKQEINDVAITPKFAMILGKMQTEKLTEE